MSDTDVAVLDSDVTCRYPAEAAGYELQHEVGRGATATVWAARATTCGEFVAVKMFYIDRLKGDKVGSLQHRCNAYGRLHARFHALPSAAHSSKVCNHAGLASMQGRAVQEVVTMRSLRHPCVLPVLAHFQVGLPCSSLQLACYH